MTEEQGSDQVDDVDDEATDTDAVEEISTADDDADGFDGEFDAPRARRTITKLRDELKAAKAKGAPKGDGEDSAAVRAENLRLRVALSSGLDADLADRLRGSTEDELLADAQKLIDRFYPEPKRPGAVRKPAGGTRPREEPELTADQIVAAATSR